MPSSNRLVVVQRFGKIVTFENDSAASETALLMDLAETQRIDKVESLGIAFHPEFETNGKFYVHPTRPGESLPTGVAQFTVKATVAAWIHDLGT